MLASESPAKAGDFPLLREQFPLILLHNPLYCLHWKQYIADAKQAERNPTGLGRFYRMNRSMNQSTKRLIHIVCENGTFRLASPLQRSHREAERDWARLALFSLYGKLNDPLSPSLPLAFGTKPMKSERVWRQGCDGMKCPPPARVRLESNGGLQPSSVVPRPIVRTPARQASSLCSQWVPPHYHKFFCAHDRFRGLACPACRRSASEAREWLVEMDITV